MKTTSPFLAAPALASAVNVAGLSVLITPVIQAGLFAISYSLDAVTFISLSPPAAANSAVVGSIVIVPVAGTSGTSGTVESSIE